MTYDNWCAECGNKLVQLDDTLRCVPCEIRDIDIESIRLEKKMSHVVVGVTVSHISEECPDKDNCKWHSEFILVEPDLVEAYAKASKKPLNLIKALLEDYLRESLSVLG